MSTIGPASSFLRMRAQYMDCGNDMLSTIYVPQIHLLLEFNGRLDTKRLEKSLRLCLDAEPVLGCRFVPRWFMPHWIRLPQQTLDAGTLLDESEGDENTRQDRLDRFLAEGLDRMTGPQLKALLLRGERGDRLAVKVNHQVVDAGGTKELGALIARIYRKLGEDADYRPPVNLGSRSLRQIFGTFSLFRLLRIFRRNIQENIDNTFPTRSLTFSTNTVPSTVRKFVFRRFSEDRVRALSEYVKQRHATLNDLLVAAMLRAYAEVLDWNGTDMLRIVNTVDLRRYLPSGQTEALCNLSCFFFVNLKRDLGKDLDETMLRVKAQIDAVKDDNIGLPFLLGGYLMSLPYPFGLAKIILRKMMAMGSKHQNFPLATTNLGPIDPQTLCFGDVDILHAVIVVPAAHPPYFVVGVSGFGDTLTLSAGFHEPAMTVEKVNALYDRIEKQLPA